MRRLCVRLCLRRRRPLTSQFDLPSREVLLRQAARLAALRGRVLRRAGVAHLGPVLDLGAGTGAVSGELVRRSRGPVVALDRRIEALGDREAFAGALPVAADGVALPFPNETFALVHAQLVFMWQRDARGLAAEIARALVPKGMLLAVEPDFGGLLEWPESIALRDVWESALCRAGADPRIGRKLPVLLESLGFRTRVDLLNAPSAPDGDRFVLLEELPLTELERRRVRDSRRQDELLPGEAKLVHLPFLFVSASRP